MGIRKTARVTVWGCPNRVFGTDVTSGDDPKKNISDWEAVRQELDVRGYVLCRKDCSGCAAALRNTAKDTFPGNDEDLADLPTSTGSFVSELEASFHTVSLVCV